MEFFLRNFPGLRLNLAPDWYELPSHLIADEIARFLEILAAGISDAEHVIRCTWNEVSNLRQLNLAKAIVHTSIPADVEPAAALATLKTLHPRLGTYTLATPGCWPEVAWDEVMVKSALATWLRQSLRSPDHPFAALTIQGLPLDELIAATSEPVELLALVEIALEHASETPDRNKARHWAHYVQESIALRLADRLDRAPRNLRQPLVQLLQKHPDGELSSHVHPALDHELKRLGLVHIAEGDRLLVPIARHANLLEKSDFDFPIPGDKDDRRRASTPRQAMFVFSPTVHLESDFDPWFVDLRLKSHAATGFAHLIVAHVAGDGAPCISYQRPGSGANTTIRATLSQAGFVPLRIRVRSSEPHICLLYTLQALLDGTYQLPDTVFQKVQRWLNDLSKKPGFRSVVSAKTRGSRPHVFQELVRLCRLAPQVQTLLSAYTQDLSELTSLACRAANDSLAASGRRLCVHYSGLQYLDTTLQLDVLKTTLTSLPCHVVLSLPLHFRFLEDSLDLLPRLNFPEFSLLNRRGNSAHLDIATATALLGARSNVNRLFENADACLKLLAHASFSVGELFNLARGSCTALPHNRVQIADVERVIKVYQKELRIWISETRADRLRSLAQGRKLRRDDAWAIQTHLALPVEDDGTCVLHPLLRDGI